MNNEINTGGPAFPRAPFEYIDNGTGLDWAVREQSGMTLRDYFAAKALPGLMGRNWDFHKGTDTQLIEIWVASAYGIADKMLEARSA